VGVGGSDSKDCIHCQKEYKWLQCEPDEYSIGREQRVNKGVPV